MVSLISFERSNFGNLITVHINDEYIEAIEGESTTEGDASKRMLGTLKDGAYRNKFGIKLKEAETYYLSSEGGVLISAGDYVTAVIHIYSNIRIAEESGMYKFTVE